jgi:hypothetical protein
MELNRVEILLSDLHLTGSPPTADALRAPFEIVADQNAYDRFQISPKVIESTHWKVFPLRRHLGRRGHFWRQYRGIDPQCSCWRLQVPLRCQPKDLRITVEDPPLQFSRIRAEVFLFPAGWSSNLTLTVKGGMDVTALQSLVDSLRTGSVVGIGPAGGVVQHLKLAALWRELAQRLKGDVYREPQLDDRLIWSTHLILGIAADPPLPAYDNPKGAMQSLAQSDQADLHSALKGKTIQISQLGALKFSCVHMQEDDFALVYFREAILAALSHVARRSVGAMRCLLVNLRDCSMMTYAMQGIAQKWDPADSSADAAAIRQAAQRVLRNLPDYYHSRYCRVLYKNLGLHLDPEAGPG